MLEPYAVKVACTVLRRERARNRSFLFDYLYTQALIPMPAIYNCSFQISMYEYQEIIRINMFMGPLYIVRDFRMTEGDRTSCSEWRNNM